MIKTIIKISKKPYTILLIFVFIIFWVKGAIFLDPDFGWRLTSGRIYLSQGIPASDPFTYTMPSFPWVDHAWLQSIIFSIFYSHGLIFLSFIYSLVAILALLIAFSINDRDENEKSLEIYRKALGKNIGNFLSFPFLLTTSVLFAFFGVRVQVFTWLMLALFLKILVKQKLWSKYRFIVPVYFLIWANLHGGFFSGLIVFFLFIVIRAYREKKIPLADLATFLISIVATLVNPYGISLWREIWSSVSDSKLRFTINEWMPALTMLHLPTMVAATFSGVFIWKQRHHFKNEQLILYFFFLIQAILSRRHLPIWIIISLAMTTHAIFMFYKQIANTKDSIQRFNIAYKLAWLGITGIIFFQLIFDYSEGVTLMEKNYYPTKAVNYISANLPKGEIFSDYGWGGYLIWKMPQKKVFIDGRMPSWRWKAPASETDSAMDDYGKILSGKLAYKEVFDKYNIDTVLWSKPSEESFIDKYISKTEDFLTKFGWEKKDFNLFGKLEKDGWEKKYQDETAVIYVK